LNRLKKEAMLRSPPAATATMVSSLTASNMGSLVVPVPAALLPLLPPPLGPPPGGAPPDVSAKLALLAALPPPAG
jgi:hypothetical protein